MRVMLTVEYEGTNYAGWQRQKNALSVQQVLEEAVLAATGREVRMVGAGRTDAGVHALGQCAHFDIETTIPPEKLSYALNLVLPEDIRVRESRRVPDGFHVLRDAHRKHYRYAIYNAEHACAVNRQVYAHVRQPLDEKQMQAAAMYLKGKHDFASFQAAGSPVMDTVRTIYAIEVRRVGECVYLDVIGNGFLYNMVRIIVGTLLEIGKGRRPAGWMSDVLEAKDRSAAGPTAPAKGLVMVSVEYGPSAFLPRERDEEAQFSEF